MIKLVKSSELKPKIIGYKKHFNTYNPLLNYNEIFISSVEKGHLRIVKKLLESKLINFNYSSFDAFELAITSNHIHMVKYFLELCDQEHPSFYPDMNDNYLLIRSYERNFDEITTILFENKYVLTLLERQGDFYNQVKKIAEHTYLLQNTQKKLKAF